MSNGIFLDIGIIIIIASVVAIVAKKYRQPIIPAYILAGLILGPGLVWLLDQTVIQSMFHITSSFDLISNKELIFTLSEVGIAFLLFIVGLEIDLKRLKDVEFVSSVGGLSQMIILFPLGFLFAIILGFTRVESIYLGILLVFSSTMVVLKMFSDKKELDTLHGKIVIGTLLIQDVLAIFVLLALSLVGKFSVIFFILSILKGVLIIIAAVLIGNYLLPKIFKFAAKYREILFLSSLSVCFLFALVFEWAGFSLAVGSFIGGVILGNMPYNLEVIGRVRSLRDFFATLFFVSLGMQISFIGFENIITPLFIILLFVIFIKPFVIMLIVSLFGYRIKTALLTGNSLGQVSEFSLIIVAHGLAMSHIGNNILSLTILATIISIITTTYYIKYQNEIFNLLKRDLAFFDKLGIKKQNHLEYLPEKAKKDVVLCGYDRTGYSILGKLIKLKKDILVVDYNPHIIKSMIKKKIPCIYGDCSNPDIIEEMNLRDVNLLISTIPDDNATLILIRKAKKENPNINIIVTGTHIEEALEFYDSGADYVILPHLLGGEHASLLLEDISTDIKRLVKTKIKHIKELNKRVELGHQKALRLEHNRREH